MHHRHLSLAQSIYKKSKQSNKQKSARREQNTRSTQRRRIETCDTFYTLTLIAKSVALQEHRGMFLAETAKGNKKNQAHRSIDTPSSDGIDTNRALTTHQHSAPSTV